jgi:PTH1 family peptidyl-tRNA hydrolase
VGLGNPGTSYAGTRHNIGADVVARLASRHGSKLRSERILRSMATEVTVAGRSLALAFPQTYMNDSGLAVAPLVRRFGIDDLEDLVVVHDELDLPVGRIQVKAGGGLAGHNGLKSIKAHLHSDAFTRIRVGIGKPAGRQQGIDHVLGPPARSEKAELDVAVELAADAVEMVLAEGVVPAQNRFNGSGV